jgi:hypothetical protein
MDAAHEAALRQAVHTPCVLVRIELGETLICLTDGGFVVYAGELYLEEQAGVGSLDTIGSLTEGGSGTTTRVEITLNAPDDVAVAALCSPANQGCQVQWWEGAVDPASGALIGQPELKFTGQFDTGRFTVSESEWSVVIECGTEGELQLVPNTDWRMNTKCHQRAWPGELGFDNVTWVTKPKYWRRSAPAGAIQSVSGGGGVDLSRAPYAQQQQV